MDCCAHEGPDGGDARFDIKKVADGVHVPLQLFSGKLRRLADARG